MITFTAFRGVLHGGMMGPAGLQVPSGEGATPPPSVGLVQMTSSLQRLGD